MLAGLDIGSLVGFEWKLAVAVASSECADLAAPTVTVVAKVRDADGVVTPYPMEMGLVQFQDFAKQFKDIATLLDAI